MCVTVKGRIKVLELFNGMQPDYHLYEAAIRHWDGYWFGKKRYLRTEGLPAPMFIHILLMGTGESFTIRTLMIRIGDCIIISVESMFENIEETALLCRAVFCIIEKFFELPYDTKSPPGMPTKGSLHTGTRGKMSAKADGCPVREQGENLPCSIESREYGQTGKEYTGTNNLRGLKSLGKKERYPDTIRERKVRGGCSGRYAGRSHGGQS